MKLPTEIINHFLYYSDNIYAYFTFGLNDVKLLNHIIVQSNGTVSMLKKAIEGSHTKIIDWILENKIHISSKIILAYTIYAKNFKIVDYILKKISCTSYDLCYMQILYLKYDRFDLFKHLNSIYPIPYFYLITIQPFSFIDKKMSVLNFTEEKTDSLFFPSYAESRNVTSLPELSSHANNMKGIINLKQKNKLYISQLAQDLIEALYCFTIRNKKYEQLEDNDKSVMNEYFKIIASLYSYDPWNYRPWKNEDNGWYIMFNSLIVYFFKNKMYDVISRIDNLRECLDNDINRSFFLCKGINLNIDDITSLPNIYQDILEKEYYIMKGQVYHNTNHPKHNSNSNSISMKANQEMNIDIFFGSIINQQLPILKNYFNQDTYNFETFLYYYLDRVTDINIMIDNTVNTNLKEFVDAICQLPISALFRQSQDSKLYIYELIQSMITICIKKCNYDSLNYIIDNILVKYNVISRYNLECCFNDAFYSNCSYEVIEMMKYLLDRLYEHYTQTENNLNSSQNHDVDDTDRNSTETFGDNTNEDDANENEVFGYEPYSLKLNLGCLSETIEVRDYTASGFNIFKKYEDLIWPLIIGQHHWLNNTADLVSLLSYSLLKIDPSSDLYDQYLSFLLDMYKENPNDTSGEYEKTTLLQKIIISSEKKSFMYLSDINPNNIIYLANRLNVNKYKFYSFLYTRFHNSNPFLSYKKMFQSKSPRNIADSYIFNKYNYPLSSEECQRFFERKGKAVALVEDEMNQINERNHGYLESNTRQHQLQHQSYNSKLAKSDNSIDLIDPFKKKSKIIFESASSSSSSSSSSGKTQKPFKSVNYNKTIKNYLNNKKYRNINVYEFKEIFKESSEWKEILTSISNYKNKISQTMENFNNIRNINNNSDSNNTGDTIDNINNEINHYSMLDLFSLIYDV